MFDLFQEVARVLIAKRLDLNNGEAAILTEVQIRRVCSGRDRDHQPQPVDSDNPFDKDLHAIGCGVLDEDCRDALVVREPKEVGEL